MSRTFSMNCGSVDSFQVSTRCGLRPKARQIREIEVWDIPRLLAIDRVDQCVSPLAGFSSRVLTITDSTCSSVMVRAAPGRGSSDKPSSRSRTNLPRHLVTVCGQIPNRAATSLFVEPSAHASTIFDRSANACEVFARRVHRDRVSRSTSDNTSSAFGRPERAIIQFYTTYSTHQQLRTLGRVWRNPL